MRAQGHRCRECLAALCKRVLLRSNQLHGLAGVAHARRHSVDGQQQRVAQLWVVGLAAQPPQNLHLLERVGGGREGSSQWGNRVANKP